MTKRLATFEPHQRTLDNVWVVRAVAHDTRGAVPVLECGDQAEASQWAATLSAVVGQ